MSRAEFEKWAKSKGYDVKMCAAAHCTTYHYADADTESVWEAWQAAISSERERCARMIGGEGDGDGTAKT